MKPLCAYLTGRCWSTAAAALRPLPPHKFHSHADIATLVFQKLPSPQDVCRRGWSPREAEQVPQPKGHGEFLFLYHAIGAWNIFSSDEVIFWGFKHSWQFEGLKGKFGKLTSKKGRSVMQSRSEVMVHDEINQEDMVQIFLWNCFCSLSTCGCNDRSKNKKEALLVAIV